MRSLGADHAAAPGTIDLARDGRTASARYPLIVEVEAPIRPDSTLVQMARLQGGGVVRTSEPRVLRADYVKLAGAWAIAEVRLETA